MADITNQIAVAFANNQVRRIARARLQMHLAMENALDAWNAGINTLFPNQAADKVIDGRQAEGLPQISGADVNNLMTRIQEHLADMTANSSAKLNTVLKCWPHADVPLGGP